MDSVKDKSEYKEMNYTLRAGKNTNTIGLPLTIAFHKQIPSQLFYVSKWKLEEYERQNFSIRMYNAFVEAAKDNPAIREFLFSFNSLPDQHKNEGIYNEQDLTAFIMKLVDCMPAIYLSAMGAPTPVNLYYENPFGGGIPGMNDEDAQGILTPANDVAAKFNKPNSFPNEN